MNCPHCGAAVTPGSRFCSQCRNRVSPDPATTPRSPSLSRGGAASASYAPASFTRPTVVTILGVLGISGGVLALCVAAALVVAALSGMEEAGLGMAAIGVVYGLIGLVQLATGVGLLGLKPWARILQIGLAVIGLLGIPCGTIIAVLILVYMLKPEVKILFSGVSPRQLAPEELEMVQRLGQSSGVVIAIVALVVVLVGVAVLGIIAAIAIPSLLRARVSANEAGAIGDLRTMVSAQAAYASANGGFPDRPECLFQPADCIPGYPPTGPRFLDPAQFQTDQRRGYRFRFVAGPEAPPPQRQGIELSPSSLAGWVYVAEPVTPGQTGVRAFCAEPSGIICADVGGVLDDISGGSCPSDCLPLQ